jgi:hypothetical protein
MYSVKRAYRTPDELSTLTETPEATHLRSPVDNLVVRIFWSSRSPAGPT